MPSPAIPLSQALYLFPIGLERLSISLVLHGAECLHISVQYIKMSPLGHFYEMCGGPYYAFPCMQYKSHDNKTPAGAKASAGVSTID